MTDHARRFRQLTAAEALCALYVDFEGEKDQPPVLLGILGHRGRGPDPNVFQEVVDPVFETAGPRLRPFRAAIETVVRRAEKHDRRIVSWSEHDLDVVRRLHDDDPELVARFEARYVNALAVAKRWRAACHDGDRPATGQLAGYLELVGYEVPDEAAPGQVGTTIRAMRPTLAAGRPLTQRQRERWTRLLAHNRRDCDGMRAVCIRATRELARREAAGREGRRAATNAA